MISLPTLVAVVALRNSINKKCANDKNLANDINNTIKTNTRNIRNKKKQWQRSQVCELCQYSKPHPCHRQYQDDMAVHGLGLPHISGIMAPSWRHLRTILTSQRHFSMASLSMASSCVAMASTSIFEATQISQRKLLHFYFLVKFHLELPWREFCWSYSVAGGNTASNTPDLFRPPKLSGAGPG